MKNRLATFMIVAAALALLAGSAAASHTLQPGSILIFPLYDASPGAGTVICVTNTNLSTVYCPETDFRLGDVLLHYVYIDGESCLEFDRYELLTPGDTLCVIAAEHNPESDKGFLVVIARRPDTGDLMEFDALIGNALVVQSDLNFLWSYNAYMFEAYADSSDVPDNCDELDHSNPDDDIVSWGDADGVPDFDDSEYDLFPLVHFVPSFFEEGSSAGFTNQLTIMSTSGQDYINEVNFLIFNNIEQKFSRTHKFTCWWSGSLSEISTIAENLGGDEEEIGHNTQTGWVRFEGNRILDLAGNPILDAAGGLARPAMLAVFAQMIQGTDFAVGDRLINSEDLIDGGEILPGDGDPRIPAGDI